jgi:hypothetical protein
VEKGGIYKMRTSRLDTPHIKHEVAKRLATAEVIKKFSSSLALDKPDHETEEDKTESS